MASNFAPLSFPVFAPENDPYRSSNLFMQGAQGLSGLLQQQADQQAQADALKSPLIQQMIQNSLSGDVMGGARALIPTVQGQAMGANTGAVTMGPTLGLQNQPPRGLVPAGSDGSMARSASPEPLPWFIDEYLGDLAGGSRPGGGFDEVVIADPNNLYSPGMYDSGIRMIGDGRSPATTSFAEDLTIAPRTLNSTSGVADLRGAAAPQAMTPKEYMLFQQMLPYYTQSNVARMQAGSAERRSADKTTSNAVTQQGKMAIELLKINESRLKREQQRELALKKLKAGGKGGNKLVEELRKAWQISVGGKQSTEGIVSQMIAAGADASESGSEARTAYDGMRAKVQEWTALENRRREEYQEALRAITGGAPSGQPAPQQGGQPQQKSQPQSKPKGLGRQIQSPDDVANASDEELMRYWKASKR
jgi:hypothetical protein